MTMTMNEYDFHEIRTRYARSQEIDPRLVRWGGLPSSYAPYGVWNADAEEDVFQSWMTDSLIGRGNLQALLDISDDAGSFRRLAERSLRQYLLDARTRSQSQNLYQRAAEILESDAEFHRFREATKRQDVGWGLAAWQQSPPASRCAEFARDERQLLAHAWSLGDFEIIRYKADARKLSPLLSTSELKRFIGGLFEASNALLTLSRIMRALELRFDLAEVNEVPLDLVAEPAFEDQQASELILEETGYAILAEMTSRQADVLLGTVEENTIDELSERLECSVGTIVNEQRRIGAIIDRHSSDASERALLMNKIADLLYDVGDDDD
jgi:hypothetical protein